MRRRTRGAVVVATIAGAALSLPVAAGHRGPTTIACGAGLTAAYDARVGRAAASGRDVWGAQLISAADGPTYERAARFLAPLFFAAGRGRRPLTASGAYYLPFSFPTDVRSTTEIALHVADGSQIITRRVGGPSVTVFVGGGGERYGSCLGRLAPAELAGGYLPILRTSYVDEHGVRYRQESFATHLPGTSSFVSFIRLTVDSRTTNHGAVVRFASTTPGRLVTAHGRATMRIPARTLAVVYADWLATPAARPMTVSARAYGRARDLVERYWRRRLSLGARIVVPDTRVQNAERALLIAQLIHGWRYSVGNEYEELSFAEALDTAEVMAEYGFPRDARAILRLSLERLPARFTSWRAGERLLAEAAYFELLRDRALVDRDAPALARVVELLRGRQLGNDRLAYEPLCSDEPEAVDALPAQVVAWQGLLGMARAWAATGHRSLAARARNIALPLERALRAAVDASETRLPDGSLFVPEVLSQHLAPYRRLTSTRHGSYWNLVMPYVFASGFFPPGGRDADGIIRYLLRHGSRLLGVTRAEAHVLYAPGTLGEGLSEVYGLSVSRFLADNDRADQLALSLYGQLAVGMTPNTFVTGEAISVLPIGSNYRRTTFMPPNLGANSSFLESLRLILIHEPRGRRGAPRGLDLAFSTPRTWLRDGGTIRITDAPTSFGTISYSIARHASRVDIRVAVPHPTAVRLRLRLPDGLRVTSVRSRNAPVRFDALTGTIRVPRRSEVRLVATVA